jgi:hypothetical protein
MSHEIVALSALARSATIDVVKAEGQTAKKYRKLADVYHADGIRSAMLETEKNGGNVELRKSVKDAITAGFTDAEQALMAKDPKTLESGAKHDRTVLKGRVDTMLNRIRNYLADDEADGTGEARETKTAFQRMHDNLDKVITALQKLENPSFDVAETVKRIKLGKALIPSV